MKELSRRELLVRGTGLGMGLVGVMLSVPAVGFLLSPLFTKQKISWVTVGPIDGVPLNQPTALYADVPVGTGYATPPVKRVVYVVKKADGEVKALSNICTHMQCDVHWAPAAEQLPLPLPRRPVRHRRQERGRPAAAAAGAVGAPPAQGRPGTHRPRDREQAGRVDLMAAQGCARR